MKFFIDGACKGNPGPMKIALFCPELNVRIVKHVGNGTNNRAEYLALIYALELIRTLNTDGRITIYSDSELMVKQMNGEYGVKSSSILPLHLIAKKLMSELGDNVTLNWIPRKNNLADSLMR